jgi:bacterioferritin-associated ferredoxin
MYVCVCHGFTERHLSASAARCDGTVAGCYRVLGVEPTCGKCVPMVRDAVRAPASSALTDRATAA